MTWNTIPLDHAAQIKRVRLRFGLTQGALAARIGAAGKAVVYQWESRKRSPSPVFGNGFRSCTLPCRRSSTHPAKNHVLRRDLSSFVERVTFNRALAHKF